MGILELFRQCGIFVFHIVQCSILLFYVLHLLICLSVIGCICVLLSNFSFKFEDTNGVTRSNVEGQTTQFLKIKGTNNDLLSTTQKLKIELHEPH
jgi:hypothetical protein